MNSSYPFFLGGFTLLQGKSAVGNLDDRMKNLLQGEENNKKSAVLVSFGSLADPRQMPPEILRTFVDTFASFPEHNFIWKFKEEDGENSNNGTNEYAKMPPNVHKFGWLNQRAILGKSKI